MIESGVGEHIVSSVVVARAADVGMKDRRAVRTALLRSVAIEIVVEDGFDRSVGPGADIERLRRGGLDALRTERFDQPHNAETRPEALFGVRALLQDQLAQRRGRRADPGGIAPDTIDRPVGATPMAGGHVLLHGRMFAVAAGAQMRGDPLALGEDLEVRPVSRTSTASRAKR